MLLLDLRNAIRQKNSEIARLHRQLSQYESRSIEKPDDEMVGRNVNQICVPNQWQWSLAGGHSVFSYLYFL